MVEKNLILYDFLTQNLKIYNTADFPWNGSNMKPKNWGIVQYRRFSKIYGIVQYRSFLVSYNCHFTENLQYCNSNLRYCTIPQIFDFNSCYLTKFWTVVGFSLLNFVTVIFKDLKEWYITPTKEVRYWNFLAKVRVLEEFPSPRL